MIVLFLFVSRGLSGLGSYTTSPRPPPPQVHRLPLAGEAKRLSTIIRNLDRPEMADAVLEIGLLKECQPLLDRVEALESEIEVQGLTTGLENEQSVMLNSARMRLVRAAHVACDSGRGGR